MPHDHDGVSRLASLLADVVERVGVERLSDAVSAFLDGQGRGPKPSLDSQMQSLLFEHGESALDWTLAEFSKRIGSNAGSLSRTPTWKRIIELREVRRDRIIESASREDDGTQTVLS